MTTSLKTLRRYERPRMIRQGGLAMIMIIVLLTLISAYLLATGINRTSTEVSIEQEQGSQNVLQQAKAALVAYAAKDAWNYATQPPYIQPGALPCPDRDNDGDADSIPDCTSAASRIGRLPWKTIGAPELRDASGEKLWYALSANFRSWTGTTVVNSDTQGQLSVVGTAPASNVVAVLIAPGTAVLDTVLLDQLQDRSAANVNRVASFLEDKNAGATDTYTTAAPGANGVYNASATTYNSMSQSAPFFSDRLLAVTHADLFSAVEPAVAARIERDIKPNLVTYFNEWGAFPFPAQFDDPTITDAAVNPVPPNHVGPGNSTDRAQDLYVGSAAAGFAGLLPLTTTATYPYAGGGSVTLTGGTAGSISGVTCTDVTTAGVDGFYCTFTINSLNSPATCGSFINRYCMVDPSFRVVGTIANVGMSFASMADSDVTVTSSGGGTTRAMSSTTLTRSLSAAGAATITFDGTHTYSRSSSSSFTRSMRVTFPVKVSTWLTCISASPPTCTDTTTPAIWFIRDQWYRQVYYAVSPGHLPGGGGTCTIGTNCLTVNNLPSARYPTLNDKRAILILMGRSLNGTTRPSPTLANYLEGSNRTALSSPLYVFEHRAGVATSINDRVVVVCPDTTLCP